MNRIIRNISLAAMLLLVLACRKQNDGVQGEAALMISINEISASTKALPSEIAKPSVTDFKISVVEQSSGHSIFSGKLSKAEQKIKVKPDEDYRVSAEFGKNAGAEIDAPYYIGTSDVVRVGLNQVETVQINCALGNALISAVYGATASEQQRFQELYSSYGLYVSCEGTEVFMSGTKNAYIKAGSAYTVEMKAISRQDNSEKRFIVPDLPQQLGAKEKLKITFGLGQGAEINVEKAELVDEERPANILFDWFPAPKVSATHRFAQDGTLLGTKLETESSFPGCKWKAEIKNANNVIVRTLSGEDSLSSDYDASAEWPYIPSGSYTVSYSYEFNGNTYSHPKTGQLVVPAPEALLLELEGGYTSYDLYKKGDISGANACDAYTFYDVNLAFKMAGNIRNNSNYQPLFNAVSGRIYAEGFNDSLKDFTGLKAGNVQNINKAGDQECKCTATFDKCQANASCTLMISGLPVSFAPPSQAAGWSGHGAVDWDDKDSDRNNIARIRLGQNTTSNPQYITYNNLAVPQGTKVQAGYDVKLHGATVATTLTLKFGDDIYFEEKSKGGAFNSSDHPFASSTTFTTSALTTSATANNSYGSGQTKSWIYSLSYRYAE